MQLMKSEIVQFVPIRLTYRIKVILIRHETIFRLKHLAPFIFGPYFRNDNSVFSRKFRLLTREFPTLIPSDYTHKADFTNVENSAKYSVSSLRHAYPR